jgi:uncharacterized protein (UPF0333 family)
MHIKNKRGQITVEYILVVTAVLVVIIAFLSNRNGPFQNQMNTTFNTAVQGINTEMGYLDSSHAASSTTDSGAPTGYNVTAN